MEFKLFDMVVTTVALPEQGIPAGLVGVIVDRYEAGEYEVEFSNERGETIAQLPLKENQLALRAPSSGRRAAA